jgi:F-type H+-transporting ATPase subunit gamma
MSRLTQLRQRIETVTNLQKTTHAMRLTSMASHSCLQKQKLFLSNYKQKIEELLKEFTSHPSATTPAKVSHAKKQLIIIVGSQKGLCGAFNNRLMHFVEESYPIKQTNNYQIISIGKKIADYLEQRTDEIQSAYNTFSGKNFVAIAHELCDIIKKSDFSHVTIFSNQPRTFFVQESMATELTLPHKDKSINPVSATTNGYESEENPADLRFYTEQMYMKATIQDLLFKSLIAEQASRFVSMDSSTRNADQLIIDMKTDYNKLRQALITRELTDLAGGVL